MRSDEIRARAGEILALDGWPRERLLELQRARLRETIAHAVAHSPYYREALGPGAADAELAELPTLSKPRLMEEFDRVATDPRLRVEPLRAFLARAEPGDSFAGEYRVFATSGATGVPGLFVYSHAEFAHWIAVGLARLARVGATPATRLIAIGAPGDVHITRQLFAAFQAGREGVPRLSAITPIDEMVDALNAYRPEAFIAYASIVGALAEEQLEGRLAIEPRFTIATSEVLTDETMRRAEAAWGAAPFNTYAATEAPGIAMGSPERVGMHVCEESVVVEVVDEDGRAVPPGLPGSKVLLTSLTNRAQPLIRYELSDAAVLADGPDPSGRPFARIARVDGRTSEILRFRAAGGEVAVHPYRLRAPFSALLDVRQYQLVQERGGALVIRVVPRAGAPRDLVANVRGAVMRVLADAGVDDPSVRIETVAAIEREGGHAAKVKLVTAA
ncbi:MAG TPA: AMP-binding protein [Planctomycetota bacterium]|nr:AMP-binding protein [Planctomycetota bacterium]